MQVIARINQTTKLISIYREADCGLIKHGFYNERKFDVATCVIHQNVGDGKDKCIQTRDYGEMQLM